MKDSREFTDDAASIHNVFLNLSTLLALPFGDIGDNFQGCTGLIIYSQSVTKTL